MLEVHQVRDEEVYRDIVRVHRSRRGKLRSGQVCRITIDRLSTHAVVRGLPDDQQDWICLDEVQREKLGVERGQRVEPKISRAGIFGWLAFMLNASDPALRAASWIGLVSLMVGLLSLAPLIDFSAVAHAAVWLVRGALGLVDVALRVVTGRS